MKSFNSIKVQLRRLDIHHGGAAFYFQFHKGTIKAAHRQSYFIVAVVFQFHKGTIKASCPTLHHRCPCTFNSIKVQLRHKKLAPLTHSQGSFNSIKVQLRLEVSLHGDVIVCAFNSIKVQLRHSSPDKTEYKKFFQFHKGTIKAPYRMARNARRRGFQFHKGTIKAIYFCLYSTYIIIFQFHKGTIKAILRRTPTQTKKPLSIP